MNVRQAAAMAFAAILSFEPMAQAQQMRGSDLYALCSSPDRAYLGACRFYIMGVVEGAEFANGTSGSPGKLTEAKRTLFCMPGAIEQDRAVSIFTDAARGLLVTNPADLQFPAVSLVISALQLAFPCKR